MGYDATQDFSEQKLRELRSKLSSNVPPGELVVTCGSYARREAVADSDLDFYSVSPADTGEEKPEWYGRLEAAVLDVVGKLPSRTGAFSAVIPTTELLKNYGGSEDTNESITRRMLYLLEGEFLTEEEKFISLRRNILERYVSNTPRDHQLAFYLLNDIIRYWRTLAVDYAHKTHGAEEIKPWAIRNVKLVFSRKLIYASGLFAVALTADRREVDKVDILEMLFSMTPIERIRYVSGEPQSTRLFQIYDMFLDRMSEDTVRHHLENLPLEERTTDQIFREIKNEGHYFSRELMGLFQRTFHASHPIHMGVVF
jgi:predicted nucleotidyltransferase